MTFRRTARVLALAGALAFFSLPGIAQARDVDYWVAAVPTTWNLAPNGHDPIMGAPVDPAEAIFPTVVYRRYTKGWRAPLQNAARSSSDGLLIPGPLIKARVGDKLRIHFKNLDTLR